jgi:tetratricopeptide (TPR) repeat protein
MRRQDTVMLDTHALVERFEARSIKQWLLARELSVHPRTVSRWLMGKVRRISRENLERLAAALSCKPDDILAPEGAEVYATREEQRRAATLISESDLLHILSPTENWKLVERLIKATLEPDLPLYELGRLYNLLSIAAWRQANYEEARRHAERALEIGEQLSLSAVRLKALFNIATIDSFEGDSRAALAGYIACLEEPAHFERERDYGSALANLSMTYRDFARFEEALDAQDKAVEIFRRLKMNFNLAISYTMYTLIYLELGLLDAAMAAIEASRECAREAGFSRQLVQLEIHLAEIEAARGESSAAIERIERALPQLIAFEGYDPEMHEAAARVYRRAGRLNDAAVQLQLGLSRMEQYPVMAAMLLQERARLALASGDSAEEERQRTAANAVFLAAGLDGRVREEVIAEYGEMFSKARSRVQQRRYEPLSKTVSRVSSREASANSKR